MATEIKIRMAADAADLFPVKAHSSDAAWDLRARVAMELPVKRSTLVPTGVFIELPENFEAQVRPRSGLALKHDLMLTNSPGTVDSNYRGEIGVIMYNAGRKPYKIERGDRIAQMVITLLPEVTFESCDELSDSERGSGGFGSSGKN